MVKKSFQVIKNNEAAWILFYSLDPAISKPLAQGIWFQAQGLDPCKLDMG
jgi:hypothetical protein